MAKEEQTTTDAVKLLTAKEQAVCQRVAALNKGLTSQRAAALLAIDEGATRAQASAQTGLTAGQVGYALTVFRRKGLAMFPDVSPVGVEPPAEATEPKKGVKVKTDKKAEKGKDKKPKKAKKSKTKKGEGKKKGKGKKK